MESKDELLIDILESLVRTIEDVSDNVVKLGDKLGQNTYDNHTNSQLVEVNHKIDKLYRLYEKNEWENHNE